MLPSPRIPDDKSITDQLDAILMSPRFARSPQLKQLLESIVKRTLAGEEMKETTLGELLFGKTSDRNVKENSNVRTYANRLRTALEEYYDTAGRPDLVLIEIPKGGYVPSFSIREPAVPPLIVGGDSVHVQQIPVQKTNALIRPWLYALIACAALGIAVAEAIIFNTRSKTVATLPASEPLTRDGREKVGPLFTDGINVYFRELVAASAGSVVLNSVPIRGGETVRVPLPIRRPTVLNFSDGSRAFLVLGGNAQDQPWFWKWQPNTLLQPLEPAESHAAIRITDSIQIEKTADEGFRILEKGRPDRQVAVPGTAENVVWQPRRRLLRFSIIDYGAESSAIWEMQNLRGKPSRLRGFPKNALDGHWNASGDVFTFVTVDTGHFVRDPGDLWIADERSPAASGGPTLKHLTHGPIAYSSPIAASDGHRVFAIGSTQRAELVRYDAGRKEFVPYLNHLRAIETDFSRDGKWVAYVLYPERTLWKMRMNGTDNVQLTFAPFEAIQPQWSPDGKTIALMGRWPEGHHLLYLVSARGGKPQELIKEPVDQGIPTWSSDGSRLVFGEHLNGRPHSELSVHILDLASRHEWKLPGSAGMWTPRWSPDGRGIAALDAAGKELFLYDTETGRWQSLLRFPSIESPAWTADSKQIFVKTAAYSGGQNTLGIQRIDIQTKALTPVVDLDGLESCDTAWYGLTPDGSPLRLRCIRTQDIYAITVPQ
jgi:Tol biopolymer transport system component